MDIKQLNEVLNIYSDGRFKYADIDAKAVYDNCINADFGSHTFEEADKFKEFVGIDENTTEEELRAIRNTLVKYWADNMDKTEEGFKMGDQMQFYTTVIDMAIDNLPEDKRIQESLTENNLRTDLIENLENDIVDLTSTIDSLMVKLKEYAANWDFEKQTNYYERIAEILQGAEVNLRNVEKRIK